MSRFYLYQIGKDQLETFEDCKLSQLLDEKP